MEFKPIRHGNKTKKDDSSADEFSARTQPTPQQPPAVRSDKDTRALYGFDDIPVENDDMEDVRFVDILKAWSKRAIQHSPLEKGAEKASEKKKRLNELKNDLKWAMQADLDEPVKRTPKQPQPLPPAATQQKPTHIQVDAEPSKTIDININFGSLPKLPSTRNVFKKAVSRLSRFRPNYRSKKTLGILAILVVTASGWLLVPGSPGSIYNQKTAVTTVDDNSPTYTTVLPSGKSVESLGGWHRVSPIDRDPVYAFSDKIGDVSINVSQQPLPQDFKTNTSERVSELAKAYGATSKIEAGSLTIYIGTSEKGPQSAITTKNDTLILMKSTKKIPNEHWASYIESLR